MVSVKGCTFKVQLEEYTPLVRRLAFNLLARLPANVEKDDLIQVGLIGLHEALNRFEEKRDIEFKTFAITRIRGAMLDCLRENDWLSRGDRRRLKIFAKVTETLRQQLGRNPYESEIATSLGLTLVEFQSLSDDLHRSELVHLEDMSSSDNSEAEEQHLPPDQHVDPVWVFEEKTRRTRLVEAIKHLPDRLQLVVEMIYEQDKTLQEVADHLGVTASRVHQLSQQAIEKLRNKLAAPAALPIRHTPVKKSSNHDDYDESGDDELITEYIFANKESINKPLPVVSLTYQGDDYSDILRPGFNLNF